MVVGVKSDPKKINSGNNLTSVLKYMLIIFRIPKSICFKVFHVKYSLILCFFLMILCDISAAHTKKATRFKSDHLKNK